MFRVYISLLSSNGFTEFSFSADFCFASQIKLFAEIGTKNDQERNSMGPRVF